MPAGRQSFASWIRGLASCLLVFLSSARLFTQSLLLQARLSLVFDPLLLQSPLLLLGHRALMSKLDSGHDPVKLVLERFFGPVCDYGLPKPQLFDTDAEATRR